MHQKKLTLEALEILDVIDRKGSFAAAAETLYRVPSTITYSMQRLEEDLDVVIFRREGRRSTLTPAGKVLLAQGRELLQAAQKIVETTRQIDSGWESQLNISIDTLFNINELYDVIEEFYKLNTGVEINLSENVLGGSLEGIIENRIDIAIGTPPPKGNIQGIKSIPVLMAEWLFVVSKNHPLTTYDLPLNKADIEPYPSIIIKDSSKNRPTLTHRIFDKDKVMRVVSLEQKIQAQIRGLGVGFSPRHRIEKYLASGELINLPIAIDAPLTPLYCIWHMNSKGKAMRWFLNKFTEISKSRSHTFQN